MANTTWSATDKTANVTLSGTNNLTATSTAGNEAVRTIAKQTTGKFYWEVTMTSATFIYGGCATAAASLANLYFTASGAAIVYASGSFYVNGADVGISVGVMSGGGILCLALDLTNNLIWARSGAAGQWNASGTANPATGVGGVSISAITSTGLYPAACYGTAAACTANFGDSAFTGAVPAGFTSGFPTAGGGGATVQARVSILA